MLTMNFYRLMQARCSGTWPDTFVTVDGAKRCLGSWQVNIDTAMRTYSQSLETTAGVCFLTGDVTPLLDLYKVDNILAGDVCAVSVPNKVTWGENNGCIEGTVTYGVLCLAGPVTITGIALLCRATENSTEYNVLMDAIALNAPVTINQGETKQLTYTIRISPSR